MFHSFVGMENVWTNKDGYLVIEAREGRVGHGEGGAW